MVINVANSTGGQVGTISGNTSFFVFSALRSLFISSPIITLTANQLTLTASSSLTLKKGSCTYSLPDKSGTIALMGDIPSSLSCTPKLRRINTTLTINAGFIIYGPGSLNFGTSLSYGALFCLGRDFDGGGARFAAQAIGFRIKHYSTISNGEETGGESYAIISTQSFNPTYMYSFNLTLS